MGLAQKAEESVAQEKNLNVLNEMLRHICAKELTNHAGREFNPSLFEIGNVPKSYLSGFWMGVILLAGEGFHLTMKIFYSSHNVKELLSKRFRKDPSELDDSLVTDFMSEYCNLSAGGAKRVLDEQGMQVGISLPLITRSFDDLFNPMEDESSMKWGHSFELVNADFKFQSSFSLETSIAGAFDKFTWEAPAEAADDDDDDDMEFL